MTPEPMGDAGLLVRFEREADALALAARLRRDGPPWLLDCVPAYATVAVYPDLDRVRLSDAADWLRHQPSPDAEDTPPGTLHEIPCDYAAGPDLASVAERLGLTPARVIELHTSVEYTVYAIGFTPGFPYLGYLPPALCGVPRLDTPRTRVEPGSVGLTGRQTGVYPLARPGGWPLIGRTSVVLVDLAAGRFPLRVGDRVRFLAVGRV